MSPLVSVIIPTYNYGSFLPDAVESVRSQSYPHWECLVVDDGSTDGTREITGKLVGADCRIRYLHQDNRGLSAARNTGMAHAAGEFIQFLDADDLLEPEKLLTQVSLLSNRPEIDIAYGDMRYFPSGKPQVQRLSRDGRDRAWMPRTSGRGRQVVEQLLKDNIMVVSSPLLRRRVIEGCGLFNEELNANEDWEYWIRCALLEMSFLYDDAPGSRTLIRRHDFSMSTDNLRMLEAKLKLHRTVAPLITDEELKLANRREMESVALLRTVERLRQGKRLRDFLDLVQLSVRSSNYSYLAYGMKLLVTGA